MTLSQRWLKLAFPASLLALCLLLWFRIARNTASLDAVPNAVGPGGWPRAMIIGVAIFALLTIISGLLEWRQSVRSGIDGGPAPATRDERGAPLKAAFGIALILAYGFAIPKIGFAFATVLFIAVWCPLGRVRSPVTVALVSLIGTAVLLYMFVALAKMPLNRGVEPFNSMTVSLYRLLRIY